MWARVGDVSCRSPAAIFPGHRCAAKCCRAAPTGRCLRSDGTAELEARYTLRTDDGVLIYVRNHGLRHGPPDVIAALAAARPVDPARYYFRGATFFETSDARYAWLTKHIIVCTGEREPVAVKLRFFKML